MKYPKIETIFDRDTKTFRVLPVIRESIKSLWMIKPEALLWTEKLDGTNFQVQINKHCILDFDDDEWWPDFVPGKRSGPVNPSDMGDAFWMEAYEKIRTNLFTFREALIAKANENALPAMLFGELIGDKIQKVGRLYIGENIRRVHFFDLCLANGNFVDWGFLQGLLKKAALLSVVGFSGDEGSGFYLDYDWLGKFLSTKMLSGFGTAPLEGFVIRPKIELRDGFGRRFMGKIKAKDFPKEAAK